MDLFKLVGQIAIEGAEEAKQKISAVGDSAKSAADDVSSSNRSISTSNKTTQSSWGRMKATVAEYKTQGMTTSQAWRAAAGSMKSDTEGASGSMVGAFAKIGAAVGTFLAVDKIITFGTTCVQSAAQVKAQTAQFEAAFGDLQGKASGMFQTIGNETGVLATRLQVVGTGAFSQFKGAGLDAAEALKKTGEYTNLAADAAAYYDMSLEEADSLMRSFIRGNTEAGDRIGLFTSETQRNEAALEKLGKKYLDCTEAEKQMIMLDIASSIYSSSGAMGQASREADGYENVMGNLKESWRQFQAVVGAPLLEKVVPIIQKLTSGISEMGEKVKAAQKWVSEHQTTVTILGIAFGTVAAAIAAYNISLHASAIAAGIATAATTAFGAVMAFVTSPVTLVVLAIGALVAAGVALYKNWDVVKEKCVEVWGKVTEAWENIKTAVSEKVESIKAAVSEKFGNIKDVVSEKFTAAKEAVVNIFNSIKDAISTAWETIKNVVQVGVMFIGSIISGAFTIITLPFRFIWENCKETIIAAWNSIKSAVSSALNAIKTTISNVWNAIVSVISPILNRIKSAISTAWNSVKSATSTAFNAVKSVASKVWNSIKSAVTSVVNAIKSTVTSVWNSIKSTTTTVFNAVKTAVSNAWNSVKTSVTEAINKVKSTISSGLNAAKSTVTSVLNAIKSKFTSIFETVKSTVSNAINKIKGMFDFEWSLPKLKLPHFSIEGEFSLNPPSVPHLSVDWYKKAMNNAMLLDKPTIFGYNAEGQYLGAGEAGQEVVAGSQTLMTMISSAVAAQNDAMAERLERIYTILVAFFPQLIEAMDKDIVMDSGALVGVLASPMNEALGKISSRKDRGR